MSAIPRNSPSRRAGRGQHPAAAAPLASRRLPRDKEILGSAAPAGAPTSRRASSCRTASKPGTSPAACCCGVAHSLAEALQGGAHSAPCGILLRENPAQSAPLAARLRARACSWLAKLRGPKRARCSSSCPCLAIVPLAGLLRHATESVARHDRRRRWAELLNATPLGNC